MLHLNISCGSKKWFQLGEVIGNVSNCSWNTVILLKVDFEVFATNIKTLCPLNSMKGKLSPSIDCELLPDG